MYILFEMIVVPESDKERNVVFKYNDHEWNYCESPISAVYTFNINDIEFGWMLNWKNKFQHTNVKYAFR